MLLYLISISPKYLDVYVEYINTTVRANSLSCNHLLGIKHQSGLQSRSDMIDNVNTLPILPEAATQLGRYIIRDRTAEPRDSKSHIPCGFAKICIARDCLVSPCHILWTMDKCPSAFQ